MGGIGALGVNTSRHVERPLDLYAPRLVCSPLSQHAVPVLMPFKWHSALFSVSDVVYVHDWECFNTLLSRCECVCVCVLDIENEIYTDVLTSQFFELSMRTVRKPTLCTVSLL